MDYTVIVVALIASIPPTVAALTAAYIAWRDLRSTARLSRDVNGRLDQLLAATRAEARAAGYREGLAAPRPPHSPHP